MDVKEFETADTDIWDSFVERSFNGTLMHQRRLLNYHPADRFQDRSVLIRDDKETPPPHASQVLDAGNG